MAVYTHNETLTSPVVHWTEVDAVISSITATQVILTNTDGTLTVLTGSGFAGSLGVPGNPAVPGALTAGTITNLARTDSSGTITYETVTGFSYSATAFSSRLTIEADLQGAGADILAGNDTLNGGSGNDFFKGFAGNDIMNGGGGLDTTRYSGPFHTGAIVAVLSSISTVTGSATAGFDTLNSVEQVIGSNSGAGDDFTATAAFVGSFGTLNVFEGRGGNDRITGNGNTRLSFNEATGGVTVDMIAGTAIGDASVGTDTFTGVNSILASQLGDSITGNGVDNIMIGQAGADTLIGGGGFDFASYETSTLGVIADLGNIANNTGDALGDTYNTIEGLMGGAFNDVLLGNGQSNTLRGFGGNDFLRGRAGADVLDGGDGFDFADYNGAAAGVLVNLANAAANTGDAAGDTFISVEHIRGSDHNDTLIGDGDNNLLRGGLGADSLDGALGIDLADYGNAAGPITLNLANTVLNTGEAIGDIYVSIEGFRGSDFGDSLTGDGGGNFLRGGLGGDVLDGAGGSDFADYRGATSGLVVNLSNTAANSGEAVGDIYLSIENLQGSEFNDTLTGDGGANTLRGRDGNDRLDGAGGIDTAVGGAGDDTYIVDNQADVVTEVAGEGNDTIFSSANLIMGINVETMFLQEGAATDGITHSGGAGIVGNSNNNNLTGDVGNDVLLGQGGNDRIDGGIGADNMSGGTGDDTFYVDNIADLTSELAGEGNDTAFSSINFVLGANVETLYLVEGSAATDGITHAAGAGIVGNSNNNNLTGSIGNDVLLGQGGNDRIDGGVGVDNMSGGTGDDTFFVDNEGDLTSELAGEGNDIAFSSINFVLGANVETLYLVEGSAATDGITHAAGAGIVGNSNANNLTGNIGNDVLLGQGGNDRIDGGLGQDNMSGGTGDDTFYVDNEGDLTSELAGEGNDTAFSSINFVLGANVETLYLVEGSAATDGLANEQGSGIIGNSNDNNLTGKGGVDVILGGLGNDRIEGAGNNDNLNGEAGNDRLIGGIGNDNLTGGFGNDFFVYTNINEGGGAADTITDFTTAAGADQDGLELRLMWGRFSGTGGIIDAAGAVASGHLTFTQAGGDTQVFADANGGVHNPGEQILLATVFNTTAASVQGLTLIL